MNIYLILGFTFGFIIGRYLLFTNIVYKGPNSNVIRSNVYKISDNEYIKFDIDMCICIPNSIL
jgi:hypothetical protein